MTNVIYEIVWIRDLLTELDFTPECSMRLHCDNKTAIYILETLIFHEHT